MSNQTTLIDFYREYPYKKQRDDCVTCQPYVSNEESTQHSYSLTYKEWLLIIKTVLKYLTLYLASGKTYRFSSGIGELQIVKYKPSKKKIDFDRTLKYYMKKLDCSREDALSYIKANPDCIKLLHQSKELDGWKFALAWFRERYPFKFARHWKIRLSKRGAWTDIYEHLKEKNFRINHVLESQFNNNSSLYKRTSNKYK